MVENIDQAVAGIQEIANSVVDSVANVVGDSADLTAIAGSYEQVADGAYGNLVDTDLGDLEGLTANIEQAAAEAEAALANVVATGDTNVADVVATGDANVADVVATGEEPALPVQENIFK